MMITFSRLLTVAAMICLGLTPASGSDRPVTTDSLEAHFEVLKVGELAFTNVWVHRQTNFNILIRHNGGIHTIKLTDLLADELAELKSQVGDLAVIDRPADSSTAGGLLEKLKTAFKTATPQTLAILGAAVVLAIGLAVVVRRRGQAVPPG